MDGQTLQKHSFSEMFLHLLDLLYLHASGLSQTLMEKEEFRVYVRGYYARASFQDYNKMHQIERAILELQHVDSINRIRALKLQFKGD